jgi:hypothetical protein
VRIQILIFEEETKQSVFFLFPPPTSEQGKGARQPLARIIKLRKSIYVRKRESESRALHNAMLGYFFSDSLTRLFLSQVFAHIGHQFFLLHGLWGQEKMQNILS